MTARKTGSLAVPVVPAVRLAEVAWTRLELTEARAVLRLEVENPNRFPIKLGRMDLSVAFGGVEVARCGVDALQRIPAGRSETIDVAISLSPIELGVEVFHVLRGRSAGYALEGGMGLDTPAGHLAIPFEASGRVPFVSR